MSNKRQVTPPVQDLARRLHGVAIRLLRRARREDAAFGLPPAQMSALSVLVFGGPTTLSALAAAEQVQPPTMTRIVDALEKAGLAARTQDTTDRRRFRIAATRDGVRLMHAGRDRRVAVLAAMLSGLDRRQRAMLTEAVGLLEQLPDKARS
jgi:DNA-binding MarR family transcriptional regulator